jgi:hypothetical protein
MFTTACHWCLYRARFIQSISSHTMSLRTILILTIHLHLGLPSGLFLQGFKPKFCMLIWLPDVWKSLSLSDDWCFSFRRKIYNHLLANCYPCPIWLLVLPLDLSFTSPTNLLLFSENLLTFHVPNLISIFRCLCCSRESIQVCGPL